MSGPIVVGEYVTNKATIHVTTDTQLPRDRPRTICGININASMVWGDETTSGIAATCRRCRKIMGRDAR